MKVKMLLFQPPGRQGGGGRGEGWTQSHCKRCARIFQELADLLVDLVRPGMSVEEVLGSSLQEGWGKGGGQLSLDSRMEVQEGEGKPVQASREEAREVLSPACLLEIHEGEGQ